MEIHQRERGMLDTSRYTMDTKLRTNRSDQKKVETIKGGCQQKDCSRLMAPYLTVVSIGSICGRP